jgi:hypothetical protein
VAVLALVLFGLEVGEGGFVGFDWAGLGRMDRMVVGPAGVIRPGRDLGRLEREMG